MVEPNVRVLTNSTVRSNRAQAFFGSNNAEFWYVPRITRGCSDCNSSARIPATPSTGSRWTRQVTESGPNNP